jgi:hypothetical protein
MTPMGKPRRVSALLTIRISATTASVLAREARRQPLLVSRRRSEKETLEFVEKAADTRAWR